MNDHLQVWRTCRSIAEVIYCIELTIREKEQLEGRVKTLETTLAAKEQLMKDEVERRTQSLQLEWNKERYRLQSQIAELRRDLSTSFLCAPTPKKSKQK
jgi:hypothetical protein